MGYEYKIIKIFGNDFGHSFTIWEGPGKAEKVEGDKRYFITSNGMWMPTDTDVGFLIELLVKNNIKKWKKKEHIETFRRILNEIEEEEGLKKDGND